MTLRITALALLVVGLSLAIAGALEFFGSNDTRGGEPGTAAPLKSLRQATGARPALCTPAPRSKGVENYDSLRRSVAANAIAQELYERHKSDLPGLLSSLGTIGHEGDEYALLLVAVEDSAGQSAKDTFDTISAADSLDSFRKGNLIKISAWHWGQQDPDAAWKVLSSLPDKKLKRSALDGLVAGWTAAVAIQCANFLAGTEPGRARDRLFRRMGETWIQSDPSGYFSWGAGDPKRASEDVLPPQLETQLGRFLSSNPQYDAETLLDQVGTAPLRLRVVEGISAGIHERPIDYWDATEIRLSKLARNDDEQAEFLRIFNLKKADVFPQEVLKRLYEVEAAGSGSISENTPASRTEEENAASLAAAAIATWMSKDPEAAVAFASNQLSSKLHVQSYERAIETWLTGDSLAAGEWIKTLERGRSRDLAAYQVVVHTTKHGALDESQEWAEAIADEELSIRALELVAQKRPKSQE